MADITNLSSFLGDVADAIRSKKGSEESIPAKKFDEEILSIETGIDTSDADATEENIEKGKTAYVNGLKVTGTLADAGGSADIIVSADNIIIGNERGWDCVSTTYTNTEKKIHNAGWKAQQHIKFEDLAPKLGVTADKITKGNTVLGVEGTAETGGAEINNQDKEITENGTYTADEGYTGLGTVTVNVPQEGGSGDIKLFETEEEMQADANAKEGDLAVVYRSEVQNATVDSKFQIATFPETVVLSEAMTDYTELTYRATDSSIMFDGRGHLDNSGFTMDCWVESDDEYKNIRIEYTSEDGITYIRTDTLGNPVDFTTEIYYTDRPEYWNDRIGKFIQVGGSTFGGLFEHKTNVLNAMGAFSISVLNNEITDTTLTDVSIPISTLEAISQQIKTSRDLASVAFTVLLDVNKTDLIIIACTYTSDPYTANCPYIIYNDAQYLPTDNKVYKEVVHYKYNLETDVLSEYEPIIENEVTLQHYNSDTHIIKGIPFDGYIVCDMFDGVPKDMTAYTWSGGTTYAEYTSKTITCDYQYTGKYFIAPTQLTLKDVNELLPGKIAYGNNGVVTGDGSIYNNLSMYKIMSGLGYDVFKDLTLVTAHQNTPGKYIIDCEPFMENGGLIQTKPISYPDIFDNCIVIPFNNSYIVFVLADGYSNRYDAIKLYNADFEQIAERTFSIPLAMTTTSNFEQALNENSITFALVEYGLTAKYNITILEVTNNSISTLKTVTYTHATSLWLASKHCERLGNYVYMSYWHDYNYIVVKIDLVNGTTSRIIQEKLSATSGTYSNNMCKLGNKVYASCYHQYNSTTYYSKLFSINESGVVSTIHTGTVYEDRCQVLYNGYVAYANKLYKLNPEDDSLTYVADTTTYIQEYYFPDNNAVVQHSLSGTSVYVGGVSRGQIHDISYLLQKVEPQYSGSTPVYLTRRIDYDNCRLYGFRYMFEYDNSTEKYTATPYSYSIHFNKCLSDSGDVAVISLNTGTDYDDTYITLENLDNIGTITLAEYKEINTMAEEVLGGVE